MPDRLAGKVCVITGAAGGIGAESARLFEDEGAIVVGVDLTEDSPGRMAIAADVTDEDAVIDMYDRTREAFGRIDVLFNNAQRRVVREGRRRSESARFRVGQRPRTREAQRRPRGLRGEFLAKAPTAYRAPLLRRDFDRGRARTRAT